MFRNAMKPSTQGLGGVCFAIAVAYSSLSFVVQDLESAIAIDAKEVPGDAADRITLMFCDFLTEQLVRNADVYFFHWISHNWSDKYCTIILRNLILVLKFGAKIIINDNLLPQRVLAIDLTMTEMPNSRERELEDRSNLFMLANHRFEFQAAKRPDGSNLWILAVEWEG
ncbi:S-adenosyl-L-methionine-dependent methyltransferase [Xylariaceae sp. AK1471]|nr:S-adenosyl-L-methionine-dependent methyltransferase [Xylariaceae sp. AK1471]